jgi:hypothetical protein
MGISYGPKLPDKDKLMLQVFPGVTNVYTDAFSNTFQVLPVEGNQFVGASGPVNQGSQYTESAWRADVSNTGDTGDTYTIYSMVSVKFPPYKMITRNGGNSSRPVRRRRFQITRIITTNVMYNQNNATDFRIGVLCPYYRTNSTGSDYKGIFAPIAFSFGFMWKQCSFSFTTDYKFNLNDWYTIAIEVHNASTAWGINKQFRLYINGELQNMTFNRGLDWNFKDLSTSSARRNYNYSTYNTRRNSAIHARPGFICTNGSVKTNASVWNVSEVKSNDNRIVSHIPKINFTPHQIFLGPDYNYRRNYTKANGVHYGPLMIYRDFYNNKVYEQFKTLNN